MNSYNKISSLWVISLVVLLSGCVTTGTTFDRVKSQEYQTGVTAKEQVLADMGKPRREQTFTTKKDLAGKDLANPLVIEELYYYFEDRSAPAISSEISPSRSAWFHFSGGKLLAYATLSSFQSDSTDFDPTQLKKIEKGKSTESDVLKLFGLPSGRSVYPAAKDVGGYGLNYEVFIFDKNTRKGTLKRLSVFFNASKVVSDFELSIK